MLRFNGLVTGGRRARRCYRPISLRDVENEISRIVVFFAFVSDWGEEGEDFAGGTMVEATASTDQEETVEELKDWISRLVNGEDDRIWTRERESGEIHLGCRDEILRPFLDKRWRHSMTLHAVEESRPGGESAEERGWEGREKTRTCGWFV